MDVRVRVEGLLVVVQQLVANLSLPISAVRMETYRPYQHGVAGDDLDMLTNYFWNIALCESLYPSLNSLEVALRNSIHANLTLSFGTDMWFDRPRLLLVKERKALDEAKAYVSTGNMPVTADRIVAKLNFGFWSALFKDPYEADLWKPNGWASFKATFPAKRKIGRSALFHRINELRLLRNCVMHYEPVWSRRNLKQEHQIIHQTLAWISPHFAQLLVEIDSFPDVYLNGRERVRSKLLKHCEAG